MREKLTYTEYRGCKDILTIDLHNDYTVIAIKIWNKNKNNYTVEFRITEDNVDKWDYISELESIVFNTNYKSINSAILKYVATLLDQNFFDYYINKYEYELKCIDKGTNFFEQERLSGVNAS